MRAARPPPAFPPPPTSLLEHLLSAEEWGCNENRQPLGFSGPPLLVGQTPSGLGRPDGKPSRTGTHGVALLPHTGV